MESYNIDTNISNAGKIKLQSFCSLCNSIYSETCVIENGKSTIDLILTNKAFSFG